jgi:hypothetical protein
VSLLPLSWHTGCSPPAGILAGPTPLPYPSICRCRHPRLLPLRAAVLLGPPSAVGAAAMGSRPAAAGSRPTAVGGRAGGPRVGAEGAARDYMRDHMRGARWLPCQEGACKPHSEAREAGAGPLKNVRGTAARPECRRRRWVATAQDMTACARRRGGGVGRDAGRGAISGKERPGRGGWIRRPHRAQGARRGSLRAPCALARSGRP